jgi:predicted Fe-S protein YdhL (DUF1289 family)
MDATGTYCNGCLRTLDEIATWSTATEEQRYAILHDVAQRRVAEAGELPADSAWGAPKAP